MVEKGPGLSLGLGERGGNTREQDRVPGNVRERAVPGAQVDGVSSGGEHLPGTRREG